MPLLDRQAFADPTLPVPSWSNIKGAVRGLMGMVTPPDPYEEAGRMVQQGRAGDYLGALETGFGAMPTTGAIKAYHASPHSFDRFDLSKIGSGEGAQTYGHGLYFADSPHVSGRGGAYDKAFTQKTGKPANIYEVNINADPEHFLDWDKRLADQPYVRERLGITPEQIDELVSPTNRSFFEPGKYEELRTNPPGNYAWFHAKNTSGDPIAASEALRQAGIPGIKYLDQGSRNPTAMLPQLQQHLSQTEGTLANFDRMPAPPGMDRNAWRSQLEGKAASLRDEIANTPEPSRNYVVFDDKLVDIARKYGLLPLGMGGFDFGQQEQK
jgi:hypothetical protein